MLAPIRTVAPTELPVTLSQAKAQLQIDDADTSWDTILNVYLDAATAYLDGWTGVLGRCMVQQTWEARYECFDEDFDLPFPDVSSVVVKYYDTANTLQTYSSSYYQLIQEDGGSEVNIYPTSPLPGITLQREDAVVITMVAGYGAASAVPSAIKQAILMMVAHWFTNRETVAVGETAVDMPFAAKALLAPYRRLGVM